MSSPDRQAVVDALAEEYSDSELSKAMALAEYEALLAEAAESVS